jgi:hypothetical protein
MLPEWTRRGSPVVAARKSREPNLMLLPGAKVSTPIGADELAIRVKKVALARSRSPNLDSALCLVGLLESELVGELVGWSTCRVGRRSLSPSGASPETPSGESENWSVGPPRRVGRRSRSPFGASHEMPSGESVK